MLKRGVSTQRVKGAPAGMRADLTRDEAFDTLFETFHEQVYAYLLARTGQKENARDLLQDVFLRAWRASDAWSGQSLSAQRYWLFAVAKHVVIDYFRRRAVRHGACAQLQAAAPEPAAVRAVEEQVVDGEMWRELNRAVAELPDGLRIPFIMQIVGGMTSRDIQEALGIPAGTVRYRVALARRHLRERLAQEAETGQGSGRR